MCSTSGCLQDVLRPTLEQAMIAPVLLQHKEPRVAVLRPNKLVSL